MDRDEFCCSRIRKNAGQAAFARILANAATQGNRPGVEKIQWITHLVHVGLHSEVRIASPLQGSGVLSLPRGSPKMPSNRIFPLWDERWGAEKRTKQQLAENSQNHIIKVARSWPRLLLKRGN